VLPRTADADPLQNPSSLEWEKLALQTAAKPFQLVAWLVGWLLLTVSSPTPYAYSPKTTQNWHGDALRPNCVRRWLLTDIYQCPV